MLLAGLLGFGNQPEVEAPLARYLAERGRCDQVMQINARVAAQDAKFHAAMFVTDEKIAACRPAWPVAWPARRPVACHVGVIGISSWSFAGFAHARFARRSRAMIRCGVVMSVLALASAGCSRHAGKVTVAGVVTTATGRHVFNATKETDEASTGPLVGLGVLAVGLVLTVAGLIVMASRSGVESSPPGGPPVPPPAPPPHVASDEELRSHKRVAQYLAERGRCDQVLQISLRVAALNLKFHAATFVTDQAIAKCLSDIPAPAG